jgi:Ca2+-binding RTX toxin-like protein
MLQRSIATALLGAVVAVGALAGGTAASDRPIAERGSNATKTVLTGVPANGKVYETTTLTATTTLAESGEPVTTGSVVFIQVGDDQGGDATCSGVAVSNAGVATCPFYFAGFTTTFLAEYAGVGQGSFDRYTIPAGTSATSAGNDTVDGRESDDEIRGRRGDDTLRGHRGDDELRGGRGDDELRGGRGDDTLNGGAGSDELRCGAGEDEVVKADSDDDLARSCEASA